MRTRTIVRREYAKIARKGGSCCGGGCSGKVASVVGYGAKELAGLPKGADMGLSCGNPQAIASLRPGETVLDLGCGGGFDVFIAARKVGPKGRVIGVDMTPEMIAKARRNAGKFANVEFRLGEIEHLPVEDASVDVVISNCVINLSPDKRRVWKEIARVLKPGGRVAVSDLALLRPLPAKVRASVEALVGCVAGAVLVEDTRRMIKAAGLVRAVLRSKSEYVNSMREWSDPVYGMIASTLPLDTTPGDFVTSLDISARKPR